jgi:hypothetical protein
LFILVTLALFVDTATLIAELLAASALHVVAALSFLDPDLAEGALLEFGPLHEFFKRFILFLGLDAQLVLLT